MVENMRNIIVAMFLLAGIMMIIFAFLKIYVTTIICFFIAWICIFLILISVKKEKEINLDEIKNEMDKIALEVSIILNRMYEILKKESSKIIRKERKYLMLRIKDQSVAKNCTIEDIKLFIQRLKERTTTIGYELTTGWIIGDEDGEEWEDVSKIIVKIDNSNTVKIDFQNEIKLENFDKILINVESMVKNKYSKQVEMNYITRDKSKPKVEYIDFGILGRYKYNRINYETDDEINAE